MIDIKRLRIVVHGDPSDVKKLEAAVKGFDKTFTDATGRLRNADGTFAKMGSSVGGLRGQMASLGAYIPSWQGLVVQGVEAAGRAVGDFVKDGIKNFGDLQQEVANIKSIAPSLDTSKMTRDLNMLQTKVPQTAKQLAESVYDIYSTIDNISQTQATKLVEVFAKGATAARSTSQVFGTAVMGVINAYHLSVDKANVISDLFFNTIKRGVVTGRELAAGLGPITSTAKLAGQSMGTMFAAIAAVTKEGGKASVNLNNLRGTLRDLSTDKARQGFKALGIDITDGHGKFKQLNVIVEEFKQKTAGLSDVAKADALKGIFKNIQSIQGFSALTSQLDAFNAALKENETTSGSAAAAYEAMSNTYNTQSQLLKQGFEAIGIEIGGRLLPLITPLISAFAQQLPGALEATRAAFDTLPSKIESTLSALAGFPITIKGMKLGFAELAASASVTLGPAFSGARDVIVAVWGEVKSFVIANSREIVQWFIQNMPLIKQTTETVLKAIAGFWKTYGGQIMGIVGATWDFIKFAIGGRIKDILTVIRATMQIINGDWKGAWETIKKNASEKLQQVQNLIGAAAKFIGNTLALLVRFVIDQKAAMFNAALKVGQSIVDGIKKGINDNLQSVKNVAANMAISAYNAAMGALQINSPSRLFIKLGAGVGAGFVLGIASGNTAASEAGRTLARHAHNGAKSQLSQSAKDLKNEAHRYSLALAGAKGKLAELQSGGSDGDANIARLFPHVDRSQLEQVNGQIKSITDAQEAAKRAKDATIALAKELHDIQTETKKQILLREATNTLDKLTIEKFFTTFGKTKFSDLTSEENRELIKQLAGLKDQEALQKEITKMLKALDDAAKSQTERNKKSFLDVIKAQLTHQKQTAEAAAKEAADVAKNTKAYTAAILAARKELEILNGLSTVDTVLEQVRNAHPGITDTSELEILLRQIEATKELKAIEKARLEQLKALRNEVKGFFVSAFEGMLTRGENIFQSLYRSFKQLLIKMVAEWAAAQIFGGGSTLSNATKPAGGKSSTLSTALGVAALLNPASNVIKGIAGISSLFGGFRAEGGNVQSGKAYVVGERGPELLFASQNGYIQSNESMRQTRRRQTDDRGANAPSFVQHVANQTINHEADENRVARKTAKMFEMAMLSLTGEM
jgi:TP901 family phage tail tape measure protein